MTDSPAESTGTEAEPRSDGRDPLEHIRSTPTYRSAGILIGTLVGLAVATQHWLGLIIGGALVALPAQTLLRGIVGGVAFGVAAVMLFVAVLWLDGFAGAAVAMRLPFWAALGIGVGAGFVGSLVRGVI